MALSELKLVLSVDGAGNVTGSLRDVEGGIDSLEKKTKSATGLMSDAWKELQGVIAGISLGIIVKESIEAALQMEKLQRQFTVFTGSASLAGKELEFIRNEANRLGMEVQGLTTEYGRFMNAIKGTTNEGEKGRKAFIGLSEGMAAIGMTANEQNRAWSQLNQGIMKGKFEMEDLKTINEAGLPIFRLMADALGITTGELLKQQQQGKILAEDVLPKLGESMHNAYGKAAAEAANSAQAQINRMNSAVFETKAAFGAALIPAFTDAVKFITPAIDKLKEFIGGLQILSIKMFAFADKTKAWVDAGGLLGMLSGKNRASFSSSITQINANAESTIADLMKRYTPSGSDYSAAEKLRQAGNKTTKLPGDNKGAAEAAKWASTYRQLAKEIEALNPIMSAHDKKLLDVSAKYAELERKKGANINKLRELKAQHLQAVETSYQTAEAIKATSNEFKEYLRIAGDESAWSQTADSVDEYHRKFRESVEDMDAATKAARDVANGIYDIERAFSEAGQSTAIETFINNLFKLKDVQNATADINISMADSDPAAQQMAAIEERYRREAELIQQRLDALAAANLTETAMYQALSDNILAMAQKRDKDIADSQRKQSEEGWQAVVGAAQKAFPKLTGLDKAVTAAFKDHTKFRLATEQERAAGAQKLVKDETRSNLSMYSAYAGAAGAVFEGLAATQDQSSRDGFETAKNYNIAAALMSTASGMMAQLAGPDGWSPTAWGRATLVGIAGATQIAQIASTSFGGGGSVSSAPSGSFAAAGGSSSSGTGLANIKAPLMDLETTRTEETYARMIESSDNVAVAIGRLSKSIDDLTQLFDEGGAGMRLATNATGLDVAIGKLPTAMSKIVGDFKTIISGDLSKILNPASFISSTMNFLFGGSVATVGAGITLAVNNGTVAAWDYIAKKKDGGLLGRDSSWTESVGNSTVSSYVTTLLKPFVSDITNMAKTLGVGFDPSEYSAKAVNIATAGRKPEEIAADLEKWTLETLQGMALTVEGLQSVVGSYDDAYAMLKQYNDALVTMNNSFLLIGKTALQGSFETAEWADAIITLMGGMDSFTETMDTYFTSMFTDAEQEAAKTAEAQRKVDSAFLDMQSTIETLAKTAPDQWEQVFTKIDDTTYLSTLKEIPNVFDELLAGGGVPKTREEFRSLVNSLDITTDSGASTFAALMNVSEAFGTVMTAADEAAAKLKEIQQATEDLNVRYLKATGQSDAADALDRQLSAQREIEAAIADGMGDAYIARLKEVLALEEQAAASESAAAATAKASEALTTATKAAESSVASITSAFANLTKAQATADAQRYGATVGGVQLSAAEYKSYGSFVTFLDQAAGELQKIADMGFPEELQAAVDQITAMVDTASKQLAGQVASARILAGDAAGALAAYTKWTMPTEGFTNPDGSFNAGAFNSQYLRNQAKQALELGAEASANALRVVNAMAVTGALDYSGNRELQMYALWDLIDYFGNGFSGDVGKTITTTMRPALDDMARIAVYTEYAPQGPGLNEIRRAQIQVNSLSGMPWMGNGETYYGDASIAYGKGLEALNRLMKDNSITAEEYATSLERLEIITGVTAETTINTYEEIQAAQLEAANALKQAGLNSMNFYLDQISAMGAELVQTAIDTSTALGKVTESIGRMKSWADVLTLSVNTAADLATGDRADIARAIAAAAADAQTRLTTADAAAAQNVLQGMTAFAGMDTVKLRDISLLLDGLKQFDSESFEQAFTRISAALVDGIITIDQYAALYSYSMQVYEGTAKSALESLEQTGNDALQILENAVNKAKEAQQAIVDNLSGLSESLHSLIEGLQTPVDETLLNRQAAQAQLRDLVASGGLPAAGEFDAAMRALSEPSSQLFSSFEAYSEDFYKTAIDLSTLSSRTDSQLSIAEQEMQRLDDILKTAQDQWDVAMGTKLAVMSVEDAVINLQNAIIALSQGQTPSLAIAGLNSFAVGTNYVPYDMVAQIHQGERIIPAADNYQLMQGNDEMLAELKALRQEVSQLRSEQRSQAAVLATNTDKTAKAMTRVMPDGDALAVRIAA